MRPSFEAIYMGLAHSLAERSTCKRLKVGTVITTLSYRKVLAVGYNGNAEKLPNECDREEAGNCGCLHSEENAIINCDSPRETPKIVFVTHQPCAQCAKRLINLGNVEAVYFASAYRSDEGAKILLYRGIKVFHLPKGGTEAVPYEPSSVYGELSQTEKSAVKNAATASSSCSCACSGGGEGCGCADKNCSCRKC